MSLDRVYTVLSRQNFLCALAYWSVVPLLVVLERLGCGKKPFDPSEIPIDRAYFHGNIPVDAPCYEEYLAILRYVYVVLGCRVSVDDVEAAKLFWRSRI